MSGLQSLLGGRVKQWVQSQEMVGGEGNCRMGGCRDFWITCGALAILCEDDFHCMSVRPSSVQCTLLVLYILMLYMDFHATWGNDLPIGPPPSIKFGGLYHIPFLPPPLGILHSRLGRGELLDGWVP